MKDAYSTDAKIAENDLVVLRDDLHFFPEYKAVYLYRLSLDPHAVAALSDFGRSTKENDRAQRRGGEDKKLRLCRGTVL